MNLIALLRQWGEDEFDILCREDLGIDIHGARPISSGMEGLLPSVVYFGQLSLIRGHLDRIRIQPPSGIPLSFIVEQDVAASALPFVPEHVNLVAIRNSTRAPEIFARIRNTNIENPRLQIGTGLLVSALCADKGLQHMVDVAYEVFGNPIFVVDGSYNYIASTRQVTMDEPTMEKERQLGYILDENVKNIRKSRLSEKVRNSGIPFYLPDTSRGKGMLISDILIHGIRVAHCALYELNRPFDDDDRMLLHWFSRMISQELQKNRFYAENRGTVHSHFLADLLEGKVANPQMARHRFQILGVTLKEHLHVLTVSPQAGTASVSRLSTVAAQLSGILPESLQVVYHESIVLLLNRAGLEDLTEGERSDLEAYAAANQLCIGMSRMFADLSDMRRHYQQAVKAAELGMRLEQKPGIYRYADQAVNHMIEICATNDNLWNFMDPAISTLLEYDRKNHTAFLETLHLSLLHPKNPTLVADRLHIHKNTLFYRMDKIRQLIGDPLEDGKRMERLLMSFSILLYMDLREK